MDKYPIPYSFGMEALEEWAREMIGAMLRLFPALLFALKQSTGRKTGGNTWKSGLLQVSLAMSTSA